jgi:hypothetical protein
MSSILEAPTTQAPEASAQATPPESAGWLRASGAPAGPAQNLSSATLAADLANRARARRAAGSAGKSPTPGAKAQPTPEPKATAPAADADPGSDDTNAASTPETEAGLEAETEETTTPADAAADPAEAGEVEAEADAEAKPELPKAVREMQKRIAKLTAQNKALKAQLGTQPKQGQETPTAVEPEGHPELRDLDQQIATYEQHLAWFDENPEGGVYKDASGRELATVAPERVALLRRQTERALAEAQGKRGVRVERLTEAAKAERARHDAEALKSYPWLANPEAPEFAEAQQILAEMPRSAVAALEAHPQARKLLAWAVTGRRVAAKAAPAPAAQPRPVPPKVMASASSAAPRATPEVSAKRELAEAEAAYEKSGRQQDFQRVQKLRRALKRL